jgi:hypothetical protein
MVYAAERLLLPDSGCFACNGIVDEARLARELQTPEERLAQRYGVELSRPEDEVDPNVITLDGLAAAAAANDFLFMFAGLHTRANLGYRIEYPERREIRFQALRRDPKCRWCSRSKDSAYAVGDARDLLPCRTGEPAVPAS